MIWVGKHSLKMHYFIFSGEEKFQMRKSLGKNAEILTGSQFQPIQMYVLLFYSQFETQRSNVK